MAEVLGPVDHRESGWARVGTRYGALRASLFALRAGPLLILLILLVVVAATTPVLPLASFLYAKRIGEHREYDVKLCVE